MEFTGINNDAMDLFNTKHSFYKLIYSRESVELETLKTYIKTNLVNSFIRVLEFLVNISILFVQEPNGSIDLCDNYQDFNNLIIKN